MFGRKEVVFVEIYPFPVSPGIGCDSGNSRECPYGTSMTSTTSIQSPYLKGKLIYERLSTKKAPEDTLHTHNLTQDWYPIVSM